MSLVLDSSATLACIYGDEKTLNGDALLDQVTREGAVVPSLWRLEIANGFQIAMHRKRIDKTFREKALWQLAAMPITIDHETDNRAWSETLQMADRYQLTTYDAAYLELAHRRKLPLATLDRQLQEAAATFGVPLLGV